MFWNEELLLICGYKMRKSTQIGESTKFNVESEHIYRVNKFKIHFFRNCFVDFSNPNLNSDGHTDI